MRALEIHDVARATACIACALEMRRSNGRERPYVSYFFHIAFRRLFPECCKHSYDWLLLTVTGANYHRCQKIALGNLSGTLDSRQNVRFPPVEGRVVSARSNSNGPIRVENETKLRAAIVARLITSR